MRAGGAARRTAMEVEVDTAAATDAAAMADSATGPVSEAEDRTQLIQPRGCVRVCVCVRVASL